MTIYKAKQENPGQKPALAISFDTK